MTESKCSKPVRPGVLPLLVLAGAGGVVFLIATEVFDLPTRSWMLISIGLAGLTYSLLWLGLRRAQAHHHEDNASRAGQADRLGPSVGRLLKSPGGIIATILGVALVCWGDHQLGLIFVLSGGLLILVGNLVRR